MELQWLYRPYYNNNEIKQEKYKLRTDTGFSLVVLLDKLTDSCWVSRIYIKNQEGQWKQQDKTEYFGLDAYLQAHDFFINFSKELEQNDELLAKLLQEQENDLTNLLIAKNKMEWK